MVGGQLTWLRNEDPEPLGLKLPVHWQALVGHLRIDAEIIIVLDIWHESKCLHHLIDFREWLARINFSRVEAVVLVVHLFCLELLAWLEELILVLSHVFLILCFFPSFPPSGTLVLSIGSILTLRCDRITLILVLLLGSLQGLQCRSLHHPVLIVSIGSPPEMCERLPGSILQV